MQSPKILSAKHAQQTQKTLALCAQQQLTQEDMWYIRDRLHERCSFFRLWPSQLQQLICKLATPKLWVQNEVLASQGSKPTCVCFILDGQAAVAVRRAPGSSLLKDVALLNGGDTFGELSLLGVQRHPAFIVVRSPQLWALAVDAQQLAQAMLKQQNMGPGTSPGAAAKAEQDAESSINIRALYKLIGETGAAEKSVLSHQQQAQVQRVQAQQLHEAVAAEEATVGSWLAPPHTQKWQQQPIFMSGAGTSTVVASPQRRSRSPHACQPGHSQLQGDKAGQCPGPKNAGNTEKFRAVQDEQEQHCAGFVKPGNWQVEAGCEQTGNDAGGSAAAGSSSGASDDDATKQSSMMLRARHSAILHMAMMNAGSHGPVQPSG